MTSLDEEIIVFEDTDTQIPCDFDTFHQAGTAPAAEWIVFVRALQCKCSGSAHRNHWLVCTSCKNLVINAPTFTCLGCNVIVGGREIIDHIEKL